MDNYVQDEINLAAPSNALGVSDQAKAGPSKPISRGSKMFLYLLVKTKSVTKRYN